MLRNALLVVLLFSLCGRGFGQAYHSSNSFFFLPQVGVARYSGQPYRYQVSLRYVPAD